MNMQRSGFTAGRRGRPLSVCKSYMLNSSYGNHKNLSHAQSRAVCWLAWQSTESRATSVHQTQVSVARAIRPQVPSVAIYCLSRTTQMLCSIAFLSKPRVVSRLYRPRPREISIQISITSPVIRLYWCFTIGIDICSSNILSALSSWLHPKTIGSLSLFSSPSGSR